MRKKNLVNIHHERVWCMSVCVYEFLGHYLCLFVSVYVGVWVSVCVPGGIHICIV